MTSSRTVYRPPQHVARAINAVQAGDSEVYAPLADAARQQYGDKHEMSPYCCSSWWLQIVAVGMQEMVYGPAVSNWVQEAIQDPTHSATPPRLSRLILWELVS